MNRLDFEDLVLQRSRCFERDEFVCNFGGIVIVKEVAQC